MMRDQDEGRGGGEPATVEHDVATSVTIVAPRPLQPLVADVTASDEELVGHFINKASAEATRRAYRSDWTLFTTWCEARGYRPLPATPMVTAAFLSELATLGSVHSRGRPLSKASIGRRLADQLQAEASRRGSNDWRAAAPLPFDLQAFGVAGRRHPGGRTPPRRWKDSRT